METATVASHESFWVATSAAAPVIALAAVVALPDLARSTSVSQRGPHRFLIVTSGSWGPRPLSHGRPQNWAWLLLQVQICTGLPFVPELPVLSMHLPDQAL
jgi:hypothetical protein